MKKSVVIKLMTCLALVTSLVSCKDMLEEYNPSNNTAEAVYTTPAGYESLVAGTYSYTRYWYGKEEGMGASEFGTDIWTLGSEGMVAASGTSGENRALHLYQNLNSANLNLTRLWRTLYSGVNMANFGIKIAEDNGAFKPDPKRTAELYFLRAFYYFHIVETWGPVHFTTEPSTKPSSTANKTAESVFYDQMISDLNKAIAALDNGVTAGRVNKSAAKAFLARVYLTKGYKSGFGSSDDFTKARDLAKDVIATSGKSLMPKYVDLWNMSKQSNNPEVLWSVNYSTDFTNTSDVYDATANPYGYGLDILSNSGNPTNNRGSNNLHAMFVPGYDRGALFPDGIAPTVRDVRNGWPFIRAKPTKYLLEVFDRSKDGRYKGSFQTTWILNIHKPAITTGRLVGKIDYKDTSLVIDINPKPSPNYYTYNVLDNFDANGASKNLSGNESQLFPALLKHMDSTRHAVGGTPSELNNGNAKSAKDVFVIRLAEMYMIAAEASFKLNDNPEAAIQINVLRTRAALPGQTAAMQIAAGDITLDFILDERAREFAGEHMRWFDLKRTNTLVTRVQALNKDAASIASYHVLRPIPQQQLDVVSNKGEFTQNFGY